MPSTSTATAGRLRFHLTAVSSNRKTGPIPVSTSSRATCDPTACPYFGNGCYAETGPQALHWRKVTEGSRGVPWADFLQLIRRLPAGQLWRHNAAGDLWKPGTVSGRAALAQLVEANRGRKGYTYSHHRRTPATVQAFKAATANGFTVNASCQTESEADAAIADGLRAVFVVPSDDQRTQWETAGGNRAVLCPAQRFEAMDCNRCRLCQCRPANIAVVFRAHGTGRRKVEAVLRTFAEVET